MTVRVLKGDCRDVLKTLPDESVHCVVTSPPYWGLRDYGVAEQIGLETTPDAFVEELVTVFREVRRVLRKDGVMFLNLGDSYFGGGRGGGGSFASERRAWHAIPCDTFDKGTSTVGASPHRRSGTLFDFGSLKPKDLVGIPWTVAFALRADGWFLRQDIIWNKKNPMPESVTDRCTKAHEYIFLLSKNGRYYYDAEAIREEWTSGRDDMRENGLRTGEAYLNQQGPQDNADVKAGRNKRSVWEVATAPFPEAHFATFPPALIEPCILAGCPKGGTVLDPFLGAGTTALVADRLGRNCIGIELNPEYAAMAERRIKSDAGMFADVELDVNWTELTRKVAAEWRVTLDYLARMD